MHECVCVCNRQNRAEARSKEGNIVETLYSKKSIQMSDQQSQFPPRRETTAISNLAERFIETVQNKVT